MRHDGCSPERCEHGNVEYIRVSEFRRWATGRRGICASARADGWFRDVLILGCLSVLSGGCAFKAPPGRASADMSAMVVDRQPYRIGVGDALDVRFYKTPELNIEKVPVRNDGKISLDLVGDVQAAGLGTDQLSDNLRSVYSKELEIRALWSSSATSGARCSSGARWASRQRSSTPRG